MNAVEPSPSDKCLRVHGHSINNKASGDCASSSTNTAIYPIYLAAGRDDTINRG